MQLESEGHQDSFLSVQARALSVRASIMYRKTCISHKELERRGRIDNDNLVIHRCLGPLHIAMNVRSILECQHVN
jgi:hypothetical protein